MRINIYIYIYIIALCLKFNEDLSKNPREHIVSVLHRLKLHTKSAKSSKTESWFIRFP